MTKTIRLGADRSCSVTVISNTFIDQYLPLANGEFIKIFVYLLRWLPDRRNMSLECIADTLHMTEKDVLRALRYWEEFKLLSLTLDEDGDVTGIQISFAALCEAAAEKTPEKPEKVIRLTAEPVNTLTSAPAAVTTEDSIPEYSIQEIASFSESVEGEQLFFIIQQYLGRTLSPGDLNTIYYIHESLGFSQELIIYLFEYCVDNGHSNMRYIEKVALSWAEKKIKTPDEARMQSESHNQMIFSVMKAFGLGNRMPSPCEIEYITRWYKNYGFSQELILEACNRTMMNVHSPSFDYADKILANWKKAGITTMQEVSLADKAYTDSKQEKTKANYSSPPVKAKPTGNKFHNFNQRSYDYSSLEKKLSAKLHASHHTDNKET